MPKVSNHDSYLMMDLEHFDLSEPFFEIEFCQLSRQEQLAKLKENYGIMAIPVSLLRKLQMLLE